MAETVEVRGLRGLIASPREGRAGFVLAAAAFACLVGAAVPFVDPSLLLVGLAGVGLMAWIAVKPPMAAYVLIGVTPLVAGIDRGLVIPVVRPNEALLLLAAGGLTLRWLATTRTGSVRWPALDRTSLSILLLAVTASILPLTWMLMRNQAIEQDDILYALIPWKYFAVYLVTRASVKTERHVWTALWISMGSAAVVGLLAILQSVQLFGVPHLLSHYYAAYGVQSTLTNSRGGSTLSLPIAVADLMTFNLAIAVGLLVRRMGHRGITIGLAMLFVAGVLAAAEFSGVIGMILGVAILAVVLKRIRLLGGFIPGFAVAALALKPVVETRLSGFQTASGVPVSWAGRWYNLTNYFWPVLFSHGNYLLGVRPAARVVAPHRAAGYIWIESGYTWLLWGGGIPLLGSFLYLVVVNVRRGFELARTRVDSVGVAGLAAAVGLSVVAVLMILDPHLTYRGSADLLFALLGLTAVGASEEG